MSYFNTLLASNIENDLCGNGVLLSQGFNGFLDISLWCESNFLYEGIAILQLHFIEGQQTRIVEVDRTNMMKSDIILFENRVSLVTQKTPNNISLVLATQSKMKISKMDFNIASARTNIGEYLEAS